MTETTNMTQALEAGRYPLASSDFTTDGEDLSICHVDLPRDGDFSFSRNGLLVMPLTMVDLNDGSTTRFSFPSQSLPDILYRHPPVMGFNGRSLPIQQVMSLEDAFHTSIHLPKNDASPLPPRNHPAVQEDEAPIGEDGSCQHILVAMQTAYSQSPPHSPTSPMKLPRNNAKMHRITTVFKMQRRSQFDELQWNPPLMVECNLGIGSNSFDPSSTIIFGGRVTKYAWNEYDQKESLLWLYSELLQNDKGITPYGYKYAVLDENPSTSPISIYRNSDWSNATEYLMDIDTWRFSDAINEAFDDNSNCYFRMRYSDQIDSAGRIYWRGWTPVITLNGNNPPIPPTSISVTTPSEST